MAKQISLNAVDECVYGCNDHGSLDSVKLFNFNGNYRLAEYSPKEEGFYMTIRCGLGGIYTMLDEWKDDRWQVGVADASSVIAYSKERICKDVVTEYCKAKLAKYHKET